MLRSEFIGLPDPDPDVMRDLGRRELVTGIGFLFWPWSARAQSSSRDLVRGAMTAWLEGTDSVAAAATLAAMEIDDPKVAGDLLVWLQEELSIVRQPETRKQQLQTILESRLARPDSIDVLVKIVVESPSQEAAEAARRLILARTDKDPSLKTLFIRRIQSERFRAKLRGDPAAAESAQLTLEDLGERAPLLKEDPPSALAETLAGSDEKKLKSELQALAASPNVADMLRGDWRALQALIRVDEKFRKLATRVLHKVWAAAPELEVDCRIYSVTRGGILQADNFSAAEVVRIRRVRVSPDLVAGSTSAPTQEAIIEAVPVEVDPAAPDEKIYVARIEHVPGGPVAGYEAVIIPWMGVEITGVTAGAAVIESGKSVTDYPVPDDQFHARHVIAVGFNQTSIPQGTLFEVRLKTVNPVMKKLGVVVTAPVAVSPAGQSVPVRVSARRTPDHRLNSLARSMTQGSWDEREMSAEAFVEWLEKELRSADREAWDQNPALDKRLRDRFSLDTFKAAYRWALQNSLDPRIIAKLAELANESPGASLPLPRRAFLHAS